MPDFRPKEDFKLRFEHDGKSFEFQVIEAKESRDILRGSVALSYNVIPLTQTGDTFGDYLWGTQDERPDGYSPEEVVILKEVWDQLGWCYFDYALVKKWPPSCKRVTHNHYIVTVTYSPLRIVNFSIDPVKVKRMWSLSVSKYKYDSDSHHWTRVPNLPSDWFINVDDKGKVQGVDVYEPVFTWTERWNWGPVLELVQRTTDASGNRGDAEFIYPMQLAYLTGTVNNDDFRGFKPYTVLFKGARGRHASPMTWEVDYTFAYNPGAWDYDSIAGRAKGTIPIGTSIIHLSPGTTEWGGWNYVEVEKRTEEETGTDGEKIIIEKPIRAKLHEIYEPADFGKLKIIEQLPLTYLNPLDGSFAVIHDVPKESSVGDLWDIHEDQRVTSVGDPCEDLS